MDPVQDQLLSWLTKLFLSLEERDVGETPMCHDQKSPEQMPLPLSLFL